MKPENYESILGMIHLGYARHEIILDGQGKPVDYRFLEVNPAFEEMTGLKANAIIGRTVTEVLPGITGAAFDWIGFYGQIAMGGGNETFEQYFELLDKWYHIQAFSTGNSQFCTVFEDISARKQLEAEINRRKAIEKELLAAKEKAEESSRLKSHFLATLSHEIRTPLNSILGFLQLLQDFDLDTTEQQKSLANIHRSSQRMLATINNIVEMSMLETGHAINRMETVDLAEVMHYLVDFFRPEANDKGLQLRAVTLPEPGRHLFITDKHKLESILSNLINNAVKYTSAGSIEFGYRLTGDEIIFRVSDTGRGIPSEKHTDIFEPFYQVEAKLSSHDEGIGLGLPIAKGFTENLVGRLWLESAEGRGTTFFVALPFLQDGRAVKDPAGEDAATAIAKASDENVKTGTTQEKDPIPEPAEKPLEAASRPLVLIAEDDDMNYRYLSTVLHSHGAVCLRTLNGQAAVQAVRENPGIALVLMDLKMPGMDGFKAVRQIRTFNTAVPVIAQTGLAMPGDRELALEAGCNDYVSKPIRVEELAGIINGWLP